ncbi:MAG: hypothetical protein LBH18_02735 [Spirochaetaceae bacterium]|jgi:hypothetical protein|nr:hypothetical protein [Spirochaetaceae bacterium]
MAKKCLLILALAGTFAGGVFAQDEDASAQSKWYNSYAPGIAGSKFLINAGIGYHMFHSRNMEIPPLSASVEYALPKIPLSVGGYFGFATNKDDDGHSVDKELRLGFGAKASYHFNFVKNFDPYISIVLGWLIDKETHTYTFWDKEYTDEYDDSELLFGFNLGARYFFTNNIGAYLELGSNSISVASIGLAVKF